jgi:prevent-host-death family protein
MDSGADEPGVPRVPLREAKATFSELVARADLVGEVTVLTKHGRAAAAIVPACLITDTPKGRAYLQQLWGYLDRWCPPGVDEDVDAARERYRRAGQRSL